MVKRNIAALLTLASLGCGLAESPGAHPDLSPKDALAVTRDSEVSRGLSGELLFTVDGCVGAIAFLPDHVVLSRCDQSTNSRVLEKRAMDGTVLWAHPLGSVQARYLDERVVALKDGSVRVAILLRENESAPPTWRFIALTSSGAVEWERDLDICGPRALLADAQGTVTFTEGRCYAGFPDGVVRLGPDGSILFRVTETELGFTRYLLHLAVAVSPRGDVIVGEADQGGSGKPARFVRLSPGGVLLGSWTTAPRTGFWAPVFLADSGHATGEIQGVSGDVPDNRLFVSVKPSNHVEAVRFVPFSEHLLTADAIQVLTTTLVTSPVHDEGETLLRWRHLDTSHVEELVLAKLRGVKTPNADYPAESSAWVSASGFAADGSALIAVGAEGRGSIGPAGLSFENGAPVVFLRVRR